MARSRSDGLMNSALFVLGGEIKAETDYFCARERIRDLIKPTQRTGLEAAYLPHFLCEINSPVPSHHLLCESLPKEGRGKHKSHWPSSKACSW